MSGEIGEAVRARRAAAGLSLRELAERVGCSISHLSQIETGQRDASDDVLGRLEASLGVEPGDLLRRARWGRTPEEVKREVADLWQRHAALAGLRGRLDEAYRSGELQRLIGDAGAEPASERLDREIPLINKVAAGYPTEFTDLGYPARIADEHVRCPASWDVRDPDAFAARVVGDSMLPEYVEGDVVIFSPARDVRSGMDCFARLEPDHESTFKRVYFEDGPGGEVFIRLQPLNAAYPARVVERERVAGLYAAVAKFRKIG